MKVLDIKRTTLQHDLGIPKLLRDTKVFIEPPNTLSFSCIGLLGYVRHRQICPYGESMPATFVQDGFALGLGWLFLHYILDLLDKLGRKLVVRPGASERDGSFDILNVGGKGQHARVSSVAGIDQRLPVDSLFVSCQQDDMLPAPAETGGANVKVRGFIFADAYYKLLDDGVGFSRTVVVDERHEAVYEAGDSVASFW